MSAAPQAQSADGHKSAHDLIASPDFKALVVKRWTVSWVLLTVLFVGYYGFIGLVATQKEMVSAKISQGGVVNVGIVLGIGTLVLAWVLTAIYVVWANKVYDPEVERLRNQLKK
jgi:uncharacterized membrane protein (DUF485 family)